MLSHVPCRDALLITCPCALQEFKASLEAARVALLPKKTFTFNKKVARVKGTELTSTPATAPEPPAPSPAAVAAAAAGASERDLALVAAGRGLAGLTDQVTTWGHLPIKAKCHAVSHVGDKCSCVYGQQDARCKERQYASRGRCS